jgi:hypothetical protein
MWDLYDQGHRMVVSTNIGWDTRTVRGVQQIGENNMGAGIALQSARRWPGLPTWYGGKCAEHREALGVIPFDGAKREVSLDFKSGELVEIPDPDLLFFPVKPLKPEDPAYSWNQKASLPLILKGLKELRPILHDRRPTVMSLVGAGNGALDGLVVFEAIVARLCDFENLTLCLYSTECDLTDVTEEEARGTL